MTELYVHEAPHHCGGILRFVRHDDGRSYERCDGCTWFYDFDKGRVSDASALVGWRQGGAA